MKLFRKTQNCLFVEEETYNWATPNNGVNRKLVLLSILFVSAALMFGALR